jgi:calcineurin-like phosphoesterase family protein
MNDTTRLKKKRVSGWLSIKNPDDLQRALVRMLNKILASSDPLFHAGRFASLANCWLNAKRLELERGKWAEIKQRLELIEQAQAFHNQNRADDFKKNLSELKEMIKIESKL